MNIQSNPNQRIQDPNLSLNLLLLMNEIYELTCGLLEEVPTFLVHCPTVSENGETATVVFEYDKEEFSLVANLTNPINDKDIVEVLQEMGEHAYERGHYTDEEALYFGEQPAKWEREQNAKESYGEMQYDAWKESNAA